MKYSPYYHPSYLHAVAGWDRNWRHTAPARTGMAFVAVAYLGAVSFETIHSTGLPETVPIGAIVTPASGGTTISTIVAAASYRADAMGDAPILVPNWPSYRWQQKPRA